MILKSFINVIRNYKFEWRFLTLLCLTLVVAILDMLSIFLLSEFVNNFNNQTPHKLFFDAQISITTIVYIFGIFTMLRLLGSYGLQIFMINSVFDLRRKMRVKLLKNCLELQTTAFGSKSTADLIYLINDCTQRQVTYTLLPGLRLITDTVLATLLSLYILTYTGLVTTTILILLVGSLLFVLTMLRRFSRKLGESDNRLGEQSLNLIENSITAYRQLKVYNKIDETIQFFDNVSRKLTQKRVLEQAATSSTRYILEAIVIMSVLTALLIYINNPSSSLAFGPALIYGTFRIVPLLSNIGRSQTQLQVGEHSIKLIESFENFLEQNSNISKNNPKNTKMLLDKSDPAIIRFEEVNLVFDDAKKEYLFKTPLSFSIQQGKRTLIYGPSGVGKTSVLDLILGLLTPTAGAILLSHEFKQNLKDGNLGYFAQTPIILYDNLSQAITDFSWSDLDENSKMKVKKVCEATCLNVLLNDDIMGNRGIGKQGTSLSGGERQRVALARALYKSSGLLILDEPFSSLDQDTYLKILNNISNNFNDITMIIISHNPEINAFIDDRIDLTKFKK